MFLLARHWLRHLPVIISIDCTDAVPKINSSSLRDPLASLVKRSSSAVFEINPTSSACQREGVVVGVVAGRTVVVAVVAAVADKAVEAQYLEEEILIIMAGVVIEVEGQPEGILVNVAEAVVDEVDHVEEQILVHAAEVAVDEVGEVVQVYRYSGKCARILKAEMDLTKQRYGNEPIPAPDANVTILEDQTQTSLATKSSQLPDNAELKLTHTIPRRPGYGTQGTSVVLWANYFPLIPKGEKKLYLYSIGIIPEIAGGKKRRLIQQLLDETPLSSMKASISTDQMSTLISCDEISAKDLIHRINYQAEGTDRPPLQPTSYTITLDRNDAVLKVSDLIDYLTSTNASAAFESKSAIVQALNIVVGYHPRIDTNNMSVANKHYAVQGQIAEKFDLRGGLIAWRGYFSSVRAATSRILLNVQIKHAATYENIRLDLLMKNFGESNKTTLGKFLKRVRVETTHLPEKKNKAEIKIPRVKTIFALASPGDGNRLDYPPKVEEFGATAEGVQFYLGGTSPTGSRPAPQLPLNQYITVQRFFKLRK